MTRWGVAGEVRQVQAEIAGWESRMRKLLEQMHRDPDDCKSAFTSLRACVRVRAA